MQQLEGYDALYDSLNQWLKDTEAKVRSEAGLRPNIEAKQSQLEAFKVSTVDCVECFQVITVCRANNKDNRKVWHSMFLCQFLRKVMSASNFLFV